MCPGAGNGVSERGMLIFVRLLRSTFGRIILRFVWRHRELLLRLVRRSYLARMIRLIR